MPSIDRIAHLTVVVLSILIMGLSADVRAASPAERCAAAKTRATGKEVFDKAKCHQKALLAAQAVDPACLAKVASRFAAAIAKADLLGVCPGTTPELQGDVDACVASFVSTTTTPAASTTSTTMGAAVEHCCFGTSLCTQANVATPGDCSAWGTLVSGGAGTVCDGTTGGCVVPPAIGGPCCQTTGIAGLACLAGPSLDEANCESLSGTFFASATCTPSGCAP